MTPAIEEQSPPRTLQQALDQNFNDGTLASAVSIIASTIPDPIECSTLEEAATRLAQMPALLTKLRSLEAENAALREAVTKSAAQFRYYEQSHREKGTSDGDHKAETNARFAMMCELALSEEQADGWRDARADGAGVPGC